MTDPLQLVEQLGRWSMGRGPLYLLLAGRLRQLIDDGELAPGTLLPADRRLAKALSVGRGTVVSAYEQLRMDARVERRQGSGTRVAGRAGPAAQRKPVTTDPLFLGLMEPNEGVIVLACNAPTAPPPELVAVYQHALRDLAATEDDIGYHPIGHHRLRDALARRYTGRGIPTSAEQIMITNGGQQAIALLATCLLRPGDQVAVEAPTYPGALEAYREAGAVPVPHGLGLDGFDKTVRERRPALAYVIATNHNPTGTTMPALRRSRLADTAASADVPIVEDEVLADLTFPGHEVPPPIASHRRATVISVGSLSKTVWGGLRVGWIRAPQPIINRLARLRAIHDLGGNIPAQLAAAELVPNLDDICRRQAAVLSARHDHLLAELKAAVPDWRVSPAHGGPTLWVRLPKGDGTSFAQTALRHGVSVLPGDGLDPSRQSADCVRLNFVLPEDVLSFVVHRLAAAWSSYDAPTRTTPGAAALAV